VGLGRRIRLYLFGFLLGGIIVWFGIMKKRPDDALTSWLPKNRILMQLDTNKISISPLIQNKLQCQGLQSENFQSLIKTGDVNFSQSGVHDKPWPKYAIETHSKDGRAIRLLCGAAPAETQILNAWVLGAKKDTCQ
jgi:hypothetical protein